MRPIVHRFKDGAEVAAATAEALSNRLTQLLGDNSEVHIQITGGTVGIQTLAELAAREDFQNLDLERLNIWWGDERYVASDSSDRNANQARAALFSKLNKKQPKLHEFPAADSGLSLDEAAEQFAKHVAEVAPKIAIALVGMGPDGHICSLFPGKPNVDEAATIIAEHDSPKPPPQRLSFSYSAMNQCEEIWFVVAGADKQPAVDVAFGETPESLPVGRVHGTVATHWYLDATAGTTVFGC